MNNNDDQALEAWEFTDEVCLKFYPKSSRAKNREQKIAAVKTILRPYANTALRTFFKAANLTSIFSGAGNNLATRLEPLPALVDHLIAMGNPLPAESVSSICARCNANLPTLIAGLERVTEKPVLRDQAGNEIWQPDEHGVLQPLRGDSTLERLNKAGLDSKSFSSILHGAGGNFDTLINEIERFLDSGGAVTYEALCAHLDAKGLLRRQSKKERPREPDLRSLQPKPKPLPKQKASSANLAICGWIKI